MKYQKQDGAWIYSHNDKRTWVDNYHTGYILDSLKDFIIYTGFTGFDENLEKGIKFYTENFFENSVLPRLYNNKT